MSIIERNLTEIEQHKQNITIKNQKLYKRIKNEHSKIFDMIWNTRDITPQEVLDSFGTDAQDLFTFSSSIQTLLSQVDSNYVALVPPMEYEINENGTVTVIEPEE